MAPPALRAVEVGQPLPGSGLDWGQIQSPREDSCILILATHSWPHTGKKVKAGGVSAA